jgi:nicotinamidase/pyrazinamidase
LAGREGAKLQLLVLDMLEGFTRIGPLASPRVQALLPKQVEFLSSLPADSLVVFLADRHRPDDVEFDRCPRHCVEGTPEAEICPELLEACERAGVQPVIVSKTTFSGFYQTGLDRIVREAPNNEWVVIGCVTDCCIEANVAELAYRGRRVTVIRDLIDTWDRSAEQARAAGLPTAWAHEADAINQHWFEHRFPSVWGCRVVNTWRELLPTAGGDAGCYARPTR